METPATLEKPAKKLRKKSPPPTPPPGHQRAAYSLGEFASLFGRHKNWAYRLVWTGKLKVVKPLGEMLVPRSEVDRLTSAPLDYETMNDQASR